MDVDEQGKGEHLIGLDSRTAPVLGPIPFYVFDETKDGFVHLPLLVRTEGTAECGRVIVMRQYEVVPARRLPQRLEASALENVVLSAATWLGS